MGDRAGVVAFHRARGPSALCSEGVAGPSATAATANAGTFLFELRESVDTGGAVLRAVRAEVGVTPGHVTVRQRCHIVTDGFLL